MFQKKLSNLEQLKLESSKIHNVFQDTANSLATVNVKIQAERDSHKAQIEALMASEKELEDTQIKNEKLANKINSFLND